MTLSITCPCGKKLLVKHEHAGKVVKCPACQTQVPIPNQNADASAPGNKSQDKLDDTDTEATQVAARTASVAKVESKSTSGTNGTSATESSAPQSSTTPTAANPNMLPAPHIHTPMDDLLEELGFRASQSRNNCPQCNSALADDVVLCVNCGFHLEKGKPLKTKRIGRLDPKEA